MPLKSRGGLSKARAFAYGSSDRDCGPAAARPRFFLWVVLPLLPYLLSFAAGAMIYVVADPHNRHCREEPAAERLISS